VTSCDYVVKPTPIVYVAVSVCVCVPTMFPVRHVVNRVDNLLRRTNPEGLIARAI